MWGDRLRTLERAEVSSVGDLDEVRMGNFARELARGARRSDLILGPDDHQGRHIKVSQIGAAVRAGRKRAQGPHERGRRLPVGKYCQFAMDLRRCTGT